MSINSINKTGFSIREMSEVHWPMVAQIYQHGIDTGFATFETEIPSYEEWNRNHISSCRIVGLENDTVLGWAALSPVSGRCVYGGVAEVSVYVAETARGIGLGKLLMEKLITASEKAGFWTLQSGIFPENIGSIELHKKVGFRYLGKRERIGQLDGFWKDNLLFERRSKVVGIN